MSLDLYSEVSGSFGDKVKHAYLIGGNFHLGRSELNSLMNAKTGVV